MIQNDSDFFNVQIDNYNGSLEVLLDLAKSQKVISSSSINNEWNRWSKTTTIIQSEKRKQAKEKIIICQFRVITSKKTKTEIARQQWVRSNITYAKSIIV